MRFVAWAIIIVSLVLAIVSAVTAYSPKVSLPEATLASRGGEPLTLAAPVGKQVIDGKPQPLAKSGEKLTPELLAQLRGAEQARVRVKEFSFARWSEWWVFVLGCVGMLAGALFIRRENARQVVMSAGESKPTESAESALRSLRGELEQLRRGVRGSAAQPSPDHPSPRLGLIIEHVERMTSAHVPPFLADRPALVSRLGLAGYAQLMDRFAAGERQLNRAWSAAADGYEEEAAECLDRAAVLLEEAEERLTPSPSGRASG